MTTTTTTNEKNFLVAIFDTNKVDGFKAFYKENFILEKATILPFRYETMEDAEKVAMRYNTLNHERQLSGKRLFLHPNVLQSLENDAKVETAKKPQSERTINRKELNYDVRVEILNFTDVFKKVRAKYLMLPNRVKQSHISESSVFLKDVLLTYCSESLSNKANEHFYLDRLALLTTDIKALKCFMTPKQLETFGAKPWSATNIIDILVKALTMNVKTYLACLEQKPKM